MVAEIILSTTFNTWDNFFLSMISNLSLSLPLLFVCQFQYLYFPENHENYKDLRIVAQWWTLSEGHMLRLYLENNLNLSSSLFLPLYWSFTFSSSLWRLWNQKVSFLLTTKHFHHAIATPLMRKLKMLFLWISWRPLLSSTKHFLNLDSCTFEDEFVKSEGGGSILKIKCTCILSTNLEGSWNFYLRSFCGPLLRQGPHLTFQHQVGWRTRLNLAWLEQLKAT